MLNLLKKYALIISFPYCVKVSHFKELIFNVVLLSKYSFYVKSTQKSGTHEILNLTQIF